jgi:hypothetical protein
MALKQNPGFLAALGLEVKPEEVAREQRQVATENALNLVDRMNYKFPSERSASQIGAMLGAGLMTRKPQLTPEMEVKKAATDAAQLRINNWRKENPDAPAEDQQLEYMRIVADEAFKYGFPDIGAEAAAQYSQAKKMKEKQAYELNRLKNESEASELLPDQAAANLKNTKASAIRQSGAGLQDIWMYGETDPNKGLYAYVNEDGSVELPDGTRLAMGEYTTKPPTRPDAWGRGGRGAGFGATNTEMGEIRALATALDRRGRTMLEVIGVLSESRDKTGTMIAAGNAGKVASFVNRWSNDLYNIVGATGAFTAQDKDGNEYTLDTTSGRQRFAKQYAQQLDSAMPAALRQSAELADRYRALMVELMYIEARTQESGAKQFSDSDVQRAAEMVGANLNDPVAIKKILMSSYNRAYDTLDFTIGNFDPEFRDKIITPGNQSRLRQQRYEVEGAFNSAFPDTTPERGVGPTASEPDAEGWVTVNGVRMRPKAQ